ncbi:hypothetical protein ACO0SA_000549 [Hanseniaspora valbyensis]
MNDYDNMNIDLFPILSVDEIYTILNKQLNYKMITIERLTKINYTRDKDSVFLIDFYKNFIFDYQLSGIKDLDPLETNDMNLFIKNNSDFATNMKLLQFIQQFLPSLGINDFKLTDLYNCDLNGNNSKRVIRTMSCLINFIRFSQERLKDVSHLINQIDIQNKLEFLQTKLMNLETEDKLFLLNKLEQLNLNNMKKNQELEDINKQKFEMEIENLKNDIDVKNRELAEKSIKIDAFNELVNFLDVDIISDLLSNDINKNLIAYKNFLNQKNQDLKTVDELETFVTKNEIMIKELEQENYNNSNSNDNNNNLVTNAKDMNDNTDNDIAESEKILETLQLIYDFLSFEKDVPSVLLTKINNLQKQNNNTQKRISELIPNWKNILVKKQNILHLFKINLLNKLDTELEKSTELYYKYKEDIILEYDQMNEEMNEYVQNIIEYL